MIMLKTKKRVIVLGLVMLAGFLGCSDRKTILDDEAIQQEKNDQRPRPALPKEWIGRWQADPFAGTEWIEVEHRRQSAGPNAVYLVKDAKVVAFLLQELKITSIQNDVARGSIPASFLTFHKKEGADLWAGVEKGQCLGTREGEVFLRGGFFPALNQQLSAQEKQQINILEPLPAARAGQVPKNAPPIQQGLEPSQEEKQRRSQETANLVAQDLPAFLKQVLNVVAHYGQGDKKLTYCMSAVESRPIIDVLAAGKMERLDWNKDRWKRELDALFKREAGSLDLTPGLGFYLMVVVSGEKEILVPMYGRLTFASSPILTIQKAIAGREHEPETIQLLPR
jgi:hypothetical protein